MGGLAVSKHEQSKSDFELIDNGIMKCLAKAFAIAMMLAFGAQAEESEWPMLTRTRMHAREKSLKNFGLVPLRCRQGRWCRA